MGLFDGTKRRHLNDLEREVLANPTPQNMVSLIERYMAAGDEAKALEMARKSVEKFPNSEKVQTTFQNVRRIQLQAEITEISKALRRSPGKSLYERLASIYHIELGNRTKAFETALEGLAKFPQSDGLHLISGLIRMDRFHTDFLGNDFTEAIHHFEKAASINSNNYKSLVNCARLFAEAGAFYKAKPILEQVLRANPGDTNAESLFQFINENLDKAAPNLDDAVAEIETRRELSTEGELIRRIFDPRRVDERPGGPGQDRGLPGRVRVDERLQVLRGADPRRDPVRVAYARHGFQGALHQVPPGDLSVLRGRVPPDGHRDVRQRGTGHVHRPHGDGRVEGLHRRHPSGPAGQERRPQCGG